MPSLLSFVSFFPELWERTATSLLDRLKKDLWYYITYTIEQFQFDNVLRIALGLEKDLKGGMVFLSNWLNVWIARYASVLQSEYSIALKSSIFFI